MKYAWILFAIAALVMTACGPAPEPTMSPDEVQGTAMAAAMTMVAETQAAIPTATPIPPTEMPSPTPLPTNTVPPLINLTASTQDAAGAGAQPQQPTQAIGFLPTNTPAQSSSGSNDPCNQPLSSWDGESAKITLVNNTKPKGTVTASLFFNASFGECGYLSAQFSNSTTLTVPVGVFSAGAFVDGPKDFKIFGGGEITRPGNYSLWFENESIILKAGCAPNC